MNPHAIKVNRTAHYYLLGEPGPHIRHLIIATHGYGQLARKFITDFQPIAREDVLIVAPEGLSKFYWNGFVGPPVASWMTHEHRLDEIADFANFLQTLYEAMVIQLSKDVQITLFGFSQGVATQLRWIHARQPHFHRLICWAGSIPEDIEYDGLAKYFAEKDLFLAYGDQDEFLTEFRIDQLKDLIKTKGLEVSYFEFEGKHEIPELAIKRCWDWVNKVQ